MIDKDDDMLRRTQQAYDDLPPGLRLGAIEAAGVGHKCSAEDRVIVDVLIDAVSRVSVRYLSVDEAAARIRDFAGDGRFLVRRWTRQKAVAERRRIRRRKHGY